MVRLGQRRRSWHELNAVLLDPRVNSDPKIQKANADSQKPRAKTLHQTSTHTQILLERFLTGICRFVLIFLVWAKVLALHDSQPMSWASSKSWWLLFFIPGVTFDLIWFVVAYRRCSKAGNDSPLWGIHNGFYHYMTHQFDFFVCHGTQDKSADTFVYSLVSPLLGFPFGTISKLMLCLHLEDCVTFAFPAVTILAPLMVSLVTALGLTTFCSRHNRTAFSSLYPVMTCCALVTACCVVDGHWASEKYITRNCATIPFVALFIVAAATLDSFLLNNLPHDLAPRMRFIAPEFAWLQAVPVLVSVALWQMGPQNGHAFDKVSWAVLVVGPIMVEGLGLLLSLSLFTSLLSASFVLFQPRTRSVPRLLDLKPNDSMPPSPSSASSNSPRSRVDPQARNEEFQKHLEFWKQELADAPPLLEIVTDSPRLTHTGDNKHQVMNFHITPSQLQSLRRAAAQTSMYALLLATWKALLVRCSRQDDVVCGCVVTSSPSSATHCLPVRTAFPAHLSMSQLAQRVFQNLLTALEHADVPLDMIAKHVAGSPQPGVTPLMQAAFAMTWKASPALAHWQFTNAHAPFYDLELHVGEERADGLYFKLYYRPQLFGLLAPNLVDMMQTILSSLCPSAPVPDDAMLTPWSKVPMLSQEQHSKVVVELNQTDYPYPHEKCIHHLFIESTIRAPKQTALVYHDSAGNICSMSYETLLGRVKRVAQSLVQECPSLQVDSMLPIFMHRSHHTVTAIYGALCTRACYVPIEPSFPSDRIQHILEETKATVVLTESSLVDALRDAGYNGNVVVVDELTAVTPESERFNVDMKQHVDSLVYVFYTSGTTGKPKGCMISHRGLVKRIDWLQALYPMLPSSVMIQKTPYSFGVSEWEFFWPLPYGSQLFIAKDGMHKDPEYLLTAIQQHHITHMCIVPSMLSLVIDFAEAEPSLAPTNIHDVFCAGEPLLPDMCRKFRKVFGKDANLVNLYGPTEADMTYWECPKDASTLTKVPIGVPMRNVKVYILDEHRNPVPLGVGGELFFGGVSTARGYVGLPTLTDSVFVPNPWHNPNRDTRLMYKTGDLARWTPQGHHLEFLGRVDHQIKLRGFRIELGEIESVMSQCEGVLRAAVVLHGSSSATHQLVAYVVPEQIDTDGIIKTLKQRLPEYMIPSLIIPIPLMPLTSRHKLDKKALPDPDAFKKKQTSKGNGNSFVEPKSPTERIILNVWQELLQTTQPISATADFAGIGGNSLLAGRATSKIRQVTGVRIPGTAMYTHATIQKIASMVDEMRGREKRDGPAPRGNQLQSPWGGKAPQSLGVMLVQLIGIMASLLMGPCALIPGWYYCYNIFYEYGLEWCFFSIPFVMVATFGAMLLCTAFIKAVLLPSLKPGVYPIWGHVYLRWWLVQNLIRNMNRTIGPFIADTPVFNLWFRLLGGKCGKRVSLNTQNWGEPSLITIGDDCVIGRSCVLCPYAIENGYLIFNTIVIEHHCRIEPRAYVVEGTHLTAGTVVGPLSTTGLGATVLSSIGEDDFSRPNFTQNWLRMWLGIPLLVVYSSVAYIPAIYLIHFLYYNYIGPAFDTYAMHYIVTCATMPFMYALVLPEVYFWLVVTFKWLFIGRFRECRLSVDEPLEYLEFCRWLLDCMVHNELFEQAMRPWINTEVLATRYRILGASVGSRTHCDFFECVEFDLVRIGDNCVFGSNVSIIPCDQEDQLRVVLERNAQVLDHCLLMPGVRICEGALCGSSTLGAKKYVFPRNSVNTGNRGGKCVQLRVRDDKGDGFSHMPLHEQAMARLARQYHRSTVRWVCFNLFNIVVVLLFAPLVQAVEMVSIVVYVYLSNWQLLNEGVASYVLNLLLAVPLYLVLCALEMLLVIALKWIIMGKYKEGNHPFYSLYHHKWVVMIALRNAVRVIEEDLNGSYFANVILRMLGCDVKDNVCMFGFGLEYDLLHLDSHSIVGWRCDGTCHTIENMVIKLAPVRIGKFSTMRAGAVVMPGAVMEEHATVMENSQVLKGEVVPSREVWAGLPAELVDRPPMLLD